MADRMHKVPVREQDPKVRATNFDEVCLGYNKEEAVAEASRCLNCPKPKCVGGCPVGIDIPGFIKNISKRKILRAQQRLLPNTVHFLLSADVFVPRKTSARVSVCSA